MTRILRRTTSNSGGFSLVELLVVVALIGLISLFALPSVTSYFKLSLNTATREMASIIKEAYNSALMTGRVHRVVFDLENREFWVESGPTTLLLDTAESKEREERRRRFSAQGDKPPPSQFSQATSITRKKIGLPRGVQFEDVYTEQARDPITEGKAYSHIFPHGLMEQTVIHLKDQSDHHVTLIVSALAGRTRLIDRYLSLQEAYER